MWIGDGFNVYEPMKSDRVSRARDIAVTRKNRRREEKLRIVGRTVREKKTADREDAGRRSAKAEVQYLKSDNPVVRGRGGGRVAQTLKVFLEE